MEHEQSDWHSMAMEMYRIGRLELEQWKGDQPDVVAYFIEDLKEALLDLKQATIDNEPIRASVFGSEVTILIAGLRELKRGE
jgi:hypothetical protein